MKPIKTSATQGHSCYSKEKKKRMQLQYSWGREATGGTWHDFLPPSQALEVEAIFLGTD